MVQSDFYEPWQNFHHAIVRQLAFVIASPNIIRFAPKELTIVHPFELHHEQFWQTQYEKYISRLHDLDQNPQKLIDFIQQLKSTRLGLRFEYLMWFWLQDDQRDQADFSLLDHSVQIIDGRHTLGEIDFVILNHHTQEIEQWEVALKFYLAEQDFQLQHWYGLNRSDTLFRKLNHFTQKQFQFTQANTYKIDRKIAVMKGQLYFPYHTELQTLPNWVSPHRRIGTWGHQLRSSFYRLERQEWICPNASQTSNEAHWWSNGLYHNVQTNQFYMYRQPALKLPYV
ncbi:DUF1853 family protein [Acinetobacter sp. YH12239]|uniref:DUF1853 family protein n=1 Tax=Acinetobacter sp. YH12239 TaxID=2601166 RepID=UPI0015D13054|nr:DUF1853 family protein [Acinetobacter sp. YH12239]